MTRFITLAGRKQVGKDTSAQYIKQIIEQATTSKVHVVHFADALKEACSVIFGIPLGDMESEIGKQKLTDVIWPVDISDGLDVCDGLADDQGITSAPSVYLPRDEGRQMNVREILQFVGTNLFRNQMDPDVWVKSIYRKQYGEDDVVVVADCRFPNEAAFAREHGLLIQVVRETGLDSDGHASETALDDYNDYHYRVNNNSSFETLRMQLQAILDEEAVLS